MRHLAWGALVIAALLPSSRGQVARAGTVAVTFDEPQLVNNDPLLNFYNDGETYRGIGPGPDYGVSFTLNARVFTQTSSLIGSFTKPGIMELYSDTAREGEAISATMDVAGGIVSSMRFDYAAIDAPGDLKIYSGLDAMGTVLADLKLPVTSPITGPGTFVTDVITFSGIGHSIVFDGGNKQLAFDDLSLLTVPEPQSWRLLATGSGLFPVAYLRRRSRMSPKRCKLA